MCVCLWLSGHFSYDWTQEDPSVLVLSHQAGRTGLRDQEKKFISSQPQNMKQHKSSILYMAIVKTTHTCHSELQGVEGPSPGNFPHQTTSDWAWPGLKVEAELKCNYRTSFTSRREFLHIQNKKPQISLRTGYKTYLA